MCFQMTSLWPRLEPLPLWVEKPARYIGCEDGDRTNIYKPVATSWLPPHSETYEIGLPNQGLQILHELPNERPDVYEERSFAPCSKHGIEHVVASPVPPTSGSSGTNQDLTTGCSVPAELRLRAAAGGPR